MKHKLHSYQKCVLKLSTALAICCNSSPSIGPHPITPNPYPYFILFVNMQLANEETYHPYAHKTNFQNTCIDHRFNCKCLSSFHHTNSFISCLVKAKNITGASKKMYDSYIYRSFLIEHTCIMGNIWCTMKKLPNTMTAI